MSEWCAGPSFEDWVMANSNWHQIMTEMLSPTDSEIVEVCGPEYLMYLDDNPPNIGR